MKTDTVSQNRRFNGGFDFDPCKIRVKRWFEMREKGDIFKNFKKDMADLIFRGLKKGLFSTAKSTGKMEKQL